MPALEKAVVRSPVSARSLVALALLTSLFIDLVPRFFLGDSEAYFFTRIGVFLPDNRSWTYGLILGWVTRATGQLISMPLLQIFLSWAAYAFFAMALTKSLGLRRHAALVIFAIGCLEPLGYYWSRSFMSDSLAQSAFIFLCGALLLQCRLPVRFILVFVAGFILISLRVVYFPAILLALLATTAWRAWSARKQASEAEAGGGPGSDRSARSWGVAAAAFLCANLTYAAVNTSATHAQRLTTNVTDMEFLTAALSPLGGDQLASTPLTPAERSVLIPLTYDNRNGSLFNPNGLVSLIRGHYKSTEAARPAMRRFVVSVIMHHPVRFVGLVVRQWGDYVNPSLVWSYQRKGYWSGAVAYQQGTQLSDPLIQLIKDWKVWPAPTADLPARSSPALWYYKMAGGVWSLLLSWCATLSVVLIFVVSKSCRSSFMVFSSLFALLYMAEIALASVDVLTRYLMPISATLLYTVATAIHLAARAGSEGAAGANFLLNLEKKALALVSR